MRFVLVLVAAIAVAGAAAESASAKAVPISDIELKVAYLGAPLITNRQAKAVPVGITRRQLFKRLHGRSGNALGSHSYLSTWKICIVYPVKGTGVKYPDGFVTANEWEFCFGFDGRLKRKFFTRP